MYCVIFRFGLTTAPDAQARFIAAWNGITEFFQTEGGALGSSLHKDSDGSFVSYARWPDEATFLRAQDMPRSQAFIRHAVEWSEVCVPSEVIFEGEMVSERPAS